ncbi:MAG: hypothetical protein H8E34_12175 [Bacteroidetes bacterium]|nr:hypothetical protein [Bacteroidota bacterium]
MKVEFRVLKIPTVVLCVFFLLAFVVSNRNYQTDCVSIDTGGYITIKIWDTKKGARYKVEQARKDALHSILYSGIAGGNGCSTQAPILKTSEDQEKFKGIENSFFEKEGIWKTFTRSAAIETTLPENIGEKNWKVYQISVSRSELRKYLEKQKIIKSLNHGF